MVSMLIPAHGGPQRREAEALRELAIACMQEDPEQHPEFESICRVGTSGSGRAPVRRPWAAGPGSGTGPGTTSPAIKMAYGGEFPVGEEGVSPYKDSRRRVGTSGTGRTPVRRT